MAQTPSASSASSAARGQREQRFLVGLARGAHRRHDAAAGAGYVFVAGAGQAHREFVGALPAVDQVRVAVHQAGAQQGAAPVKARQGGVRDGQSLAGAHPGDPAVRHHQAEFARYPVDPFQRPGQGAKVFPDAIGGRQISYQLRSYN